LNFTQAIKRAPGFRQVREYIDHRRQQRKWTTVHRATASKSSLAVFTNIGLGDVAVAEQICQAFRRYCDEAGDPGIGELVITAGAWPPHFGVERGDHNVYWWWSMNGREDWLDAYLAKINVPPDVVACLSGWCTNYAKNLGCRTITLPLAAGTAFTPLSLPREGVGYAGSKLHKDAKQVECMISPFVGTPGFEWVCDLPTLDDVGAFYNRKQIVLGMTESFQEKAGMVNARVFEVLATGSPFIIHRHRALQEVFGFDYPYQSASADQTRAMAQDILTDYEKHLAVFTRYQALIAEEHTYLKRIANLVTFLKDA
jgi:hypothetical protein